MALMQAFSTWVRQRFGWSNSRQSWEERLGLLVMLGGIIWLSLAGRSLPKMQQGILWGLLLLAGAVLLRRGWLKLFGPVLFYDMITAARRKRYFGLRCFYAGFLLFILFSAYINTDFLGLSPEQRAARFAENYFETFMLVQLVSVFLLTPAYVAGSVADEKVRRTLEFLLATDLRNREIVLSKLFSRLANLTLFLLTGLPILSLVQFLGGVDPNLVLAGFAATGMTMAGLGGLSILNSVTFKRPREAIAMTYLVALTYLALSLLGERLLRPLSLGGNPIWPSFSQLSVGDLLDLFNTGNLFLVLGQIAWSSRVGNLANTVPALLGNYALFHGVIFLVCTILAVLRLRRVALRQMYGTTRRISRLLQPLGRPAVGDQPMLWKEFFIEGGLRFNWLTAIITALLVVATLLPGGGILLSGLLAPRNPGANPWDAWWTVAREMNVYVRTAGTGVACLMLLGVAVRASHAISSERERQTFDGLLTTPMDSHTMLWSKWLGSILSIRLGWVWLGVIWLMGLVTGGLHIFALPLLLGAWLVYAAVVAMIGLWFSAVSRSTMRATIWTLFSVVGLAVGHWLLWLLCIPMIAFGGPGRGLETVAKFQAGLTPPAVLAIISFTGEDFQGINQEMAEFIGYSLVGLFLWAAAGLAFWAGVLGPRFRILTGRQDVRIPEAMAGGFLAPRLRPASISQRGMRPRDVILLEEAPAPRADLPNKPTPPPLPVILLEEPATKPKSSSPNVRDRSRPRKGGQDGSRPET